MTSTPEEIVALAEDYLTGKDGLHLSKTIYQHVLRNGGSLPSEEPSVENPLGTNPVMELENILAKHPDKFFRNGRNQWMLNPA